MSLPTPLWPLRCLCRCEPSTRPTKAKGKNSSRKTTKTTEAQSDVDDIVDLEKRSTPRQGEDEDYAKTVDECVHVELTKQYFVACGTEKPRHKSALCNNKNPMSQ